MSGLPLPPTNPGLQAPAVQAALLRGVGQQIPATVAGEPLEVGQIVTGRIGAGEGGGGPVLVLGGVRIAAQLPAGLEVGQQLRLQVQERSAERVVLKIVADAAAASGADPAGGAGAVPAQQAGGPAQQASAIAPPLVAIPMPGGAQVRLWLDPDGAGESPEAGGAARTRTMVVRYDSPVLGRTDVVLRLDPGQLDATVLAAAGVPLELVRAGVPELRMALAAAVERPVALATGGRVPEDVDVRA